MAHLNQCRSCNGSGTVLVSSVKVEGPISFVAMVAEAFIPFAGKRVRCRRCGGRGYYQPIKTNYR